MSSIAAHTVIAPKPASPAVPVPGLPSAEAEPSLPPPASLDVVLSVLPASEEASPEPLPASSEPLLPSPEPLPVLPEPLPSPEPLSPPEPLSHLQEQSSRPQLQIPQPGQ